MLLDEHDAKLSLYKPPASKEYVASLAVFQPGLSPVYQGRGHTLEKAIGEAIGSAGMSLSEQTLKAGW